MPEETPGQVLAFYGDPEDPDHQPFPAARVREWMDADDIDIAGAAYTLLSKPVFSERIQPKLEFDEYNEFFLSYFGRCIRLNPESPFADTRYGAARDFVNWFKIVSADKNLSRAALVRMKDWLAALYLEGDQEIQHCLITGALEHLTRVPGFARLFEDWKSHPVLHNALKEARLFNTT
jgi:hypothetical protein